MGKIEDNIMDFSFLDRWAKRIKAMGFTAGIIIGSVGTLIATKVF